MRVKAGQNVGWEPAFTLVEMLIVLALLGLAFIPMLSGLVSGLRVGKYVDGSVRAMQLAETKMEELRGRNFAAIIAEIRTAVPNTSPFEREVLVTSVNSTLKDVEVKVYWPEREGEEQYALRTYVSSFEVGGP